MDKELAMNANRLVAFLQKPAQEFTKADIINYIRQNDIRMVNFLTSSLRHPKCQSDRKGGLASVVPGSTS